MLVEEFFSYLGQVQAVGCFSSHPVRSWI